MEQKAEVRFLKEDKFEISPASTAAKIYADKRKEGYDSSGPNPLELFLSSLGACVGVYAKMYLERHNIKFSVLKIGVTADFTQSNPARLVDIKARIDTDAELGKDREVFLRFARNCPIHNTLLHTKEIDIQLG